MADLPDIFKLIKQILLGILDKNSKKLIKTVQIDSGQIEKVMGESNTQGVFVFPAALVHFGDIIYTEKTSKVDEGEAIMKIKIAIKDFNRDELEIFEIRKKVNKALRDASRVHPELVKLSRLRESQPLTYSQVLEWWIEYKIIFEETSGFTYQDYVDANSVLINPEAPISIEECEEVVESDFTLPVVVEPIRILTLSKDYIYEGGISGVDVGELGVQNGVGKYNYALVAGAGDDDNSLFWIESGVLKTFGSLDFSTSQTHKVRIKAFNASTNSVYAELTINVIEDDGIVSKPTIISVSNQSINENNSINDLIGVVSADGSPSPTFSLVSGVGDDGNESFNISGNQLRANQNFNFESKSTYSIRLKATNAIGSYEESFAISVTDVSDDVPTDITLSANSIAENNSINDVIGELSSDGGGDLTFSLVNGVNGNDNTSFNIDGFNLRANKLFDFETKASYSVRIRVTNAFGFYEESFAISVTNVADDVPTDITLSANSIAENNSINDVIGELSADGTPALTFSLVAGAGDTDNASFNIDGTNLRASEAFDFETKASYSVRIRVANAFGFYEESFAISVANLGDEVSTNITLSANSITENNSINDVIGELSSDGTPALTFSLVAGAGDTDNASFNIDGTDLRASEAFDFETKASYSVRIRVTNAFGFHEESFTISVTDVADDVPTDITLSSNSIYENNSINGVVGDLSSDGTPALTFSLVAGTGDTDNASFNIDGTDLRASEAFDFETKASYSVRIRVTNAFGFHEENFTISVTDVLEGSPSSSFYIDPDIGNDLSDGSINSPWATITKANNTLIAGETVYLRSGDYDCDIVGAISPSNNGTSGNYITYRSYPNETVTLKNKDIPINLSNNNYIKVDGIDEDGEGVWENSDIDTWVYFSNSQYCVVENCNFLYAKGWNGVELDNDSKYNIIRNNNIDYTGVWNDGFDNDRGDCVGFKECDSNLFEGNYVKHGGHSLFYCSGRNNIIRHNTFDGDFSDVESGVVGCRAIAQNDGADGYLGEVSKFNLYEDNLVINTGASSDTPIDNPGNKCQGRGNIMRFNIFKDKTNQGPMIQTIANSTGPYSSYNMIYHNVFNNNLGMDWNVQDLTGATSITENRFFNNLSYNNCQDPWDGVGGSKDVSIRNQITGEGFTAPNGNYVENNIFYNPNHPSDPVDTAGYIYMKDSGNRNTVEFYDVDNPTVNNNLGDNDPLIVDTVDFALQDGSPAIGAAKELTRTNGAGSGTTITVDSPYVFNAGISQLSIDGDEIIINGNVVKIVSIDHDNNQITIDSSISWLDNEQIFLERTGNIPDMGLNPQEVVVPEVEATIMSIASLSDNKMLDELGERYDVDGNERTLWGGEFLEFNGTDQGINVNSNDDNLIPEFTNKLTFNTYVYDEGASGTYYFQFGDGGDQNNRLIFTSNNGSNKPRIWEGSAGAWLTFTDDFPFDEWLLLTLVLNDQSIKMFINGVFIEEVTLVNSIDLSDNANFSIFNLTTGGTSTNRLDGSLAYYQLFNQAFSDEDCQWLGSNPHKLIWNREESAITKQDCKLFLAAGNQTGSSLFDLISGDEYPLTNYNANQRVPDMVPNFADTEGYTAYSVLDGTHIGDFITKTDGGTKTINCSGDFTVEFIAATNGVTSGAYAILGGESSIHHIVLVQDTSIELRAGNADLNTVVSISDTKVSKYYKITRVGTTITMNVEGVDYVFENESDNFAPTKIGARNVTDTLPFEGFIKWIKIIDSAGIEREWNSVNNLSDDNNNDCEVVWQTTEPEQFVSHKKQAYIEVGTNSILDGSNIITLDTPIACAGDFDIEWRCKTENASNGSNRAILGSAGGHYIRLKVNDKIQMNYDDAGTTSSSSINSNKWTTYRITRINDDVTWYVNGIPESEGLEPGLLTIDTLFAYSGTSGEFEGRFKYISINNGGVEHYWDALSNFTIDNASGNNGTWNSVPSTETIEDTEKDVLGGDLQFKGKAPYDLNVKQSYGLSFDGIDQWLAAGTNKFITKNKFSASISGIFDKTSDFSIIGSTSDATRVFYIQGSDSLTISAASLTESNSYSFSNALDLFDNTSFLKFTFKADGATSKLIISDHNGNRFEGTALASIENTTTTDLTYGFDRFGRQKNSYYSSTHTDSIIYDSIVLSDSDLELLHNRTSIPTGVTSHLVFSQGASGEVIDLVKDVSHPLASYNSNQWVLQDYFHWNLTKGFSKGRLFDGVDDDIELSDSIKDSFKKENDFSIETEFIFLTEGEEYPIITATPDNDNRFTIMRLANNKLLVSNYLPPVWSGISWDDIEAGVYYKLTIENNSGVLSGTLNGDSNYNTDSTSSPNSAISKVILGQLTNQADAKVLNGILFNFKLNGTEYNEANNWGSGSTITGTEVFHLPNTKSGISYLNPNVIGHNNAESIISAPDNVFELAYGENKDWGYARYFGGSSGYRILYGSEERELIASSVDYSYEIEFILGTISGEESIMQCTQSTNDRIYCQANNGVVRAGYFTNLSTWYALEWTNIKVNTYCKVKISHSSGVTTGTLNEKEPDNIIETTAATTSSNPNLVLGLNSSLNTIAPFSGTIYSFKINNDLYDESNDWGNGVISGAIKVYAAKDLYGLSGKVFYDLDVDNSPIEIDYEELESIIADTTDKVIAVESEENKAITQIKIK